MRPYIQFSIDQLEAEFGRAKQGRDRSTLKAIAQELKFRTTARAGDLATEVSAILAASAQAKGTSPSGGGSSPTYPGKPKQPAPKTGKLPFQPTPEQGAAMEAFRTRGSLKVNAYAGTGKTSTLELLAHDSDRKGQYIAFNRNIVQEAKVRFPTRVNCSTTHSLALQLIRPQFSGDKSKLFDQINVNHLVEELGLKRWRVDARHSLEPRSQGALILSTIRKYAQSADREISREHVPHHGSLLSASQQSLRAVEEFAMQGARYIWARMIDRNDRLPLGHDGYLKLWALSEPVIAGDYILLDEAQDTNPVVLDVLQKQEAQMVYVGDKYQQIYEWRGAVNAMERIETEHSSYLTTSFRFSETVAEIATHLLGKMGEHRPLRGNNAKRTKIVADGSAPTILARTNASTIGAVIEALDAGSKPHLVGGTEELMTLLRGVQDLKQGQPCSAVPDLFGFNNWNEVVEFARDGEGEHLLTFVNLVEGRGERQLMWALARTVDPDEAEVVISTAHKAKGREWPAVRLLDDFMKSRARRKLQGDADEKPDHDPAELRLLYVAVTRAKEALILPPSLFPILGLPQPGVTAFEPTSVRQAPKAIVVKSPPKPARAQPWAPPKNWEAQTPEGAPRPRVEPPSAPVPSPAPPPSASRPTASSSPWPPAQLPKAPERPSHQSPTKRPSIWDWLFRK